MKKLKKILIINWLYYTKELVELEDITFLTGNTGAGKSTFIDALQIVMLGELNARNFNKAANESSQRTLDSYLRADMDDKNQKSRRGKDFSSYIACEFHDDIEKRQFVLGVVFDCRSDGTRREQFFTYDGTIPQNCFIVDRQPMDISALRKWFKDQPSLRAIMYDSNKKYRDDILAKWNVHTDQLFRMFKMAISFKPIVDIQDFITRNICDIPDKPDIEAMQQNIRDYKHHELLAERQEEKLVALDEIAKHFREMQAAIDRLQIQRFITLYAEKEDIDARLLRLEQEKTERTEEIERLVNRITELKEKVAQARLRKDQLLADRAQNDVYQEKLRLEEQQRVLTQEAKQIADLLKNTALEIKREAQSLCSLCGRIESWSQNDELTSLRHEANRLILAFEPLRTCTEEHFAHPLGVFEAAQAQMSAFSACMQDTAYTIRHLYSELRGEHDRNSAIIADLKRGVKDYPNGLLQQCAALRQRLAIKLGCEPEVEILADVLEIADGQEQWRGAVEGYLSSQKFNILVEPSIYVQALEVFDALKGQHQNTFGLVDIGKLREKEKLTAWDDSLASKVTTENPLARSYIDYLLGHVVCCAHWSKLRRHRTAITAEGMLYQGYVARPIKRERMADSFIGRRAIAHRMERLKTRQSELEQDIALWKPIMTELDVQNEREDILFTLRFVHNEVAECRLKYNRKKDIERDLKLVDERLSEMNIFWLSQIDAEIKAIEDSIQEMEGDREHDVNQKGRAEERLRTLDVEELPGQYQLLTEKEDKLSEEFSAQYHDTVGLPRYRQELERLRHPAAVAKNFGESVPQSHKAVEANKRSLFSARNDYVRRFQPCAFQVEVMHNDEFNAEREALHESELPRYREKIRLARESAMEQFQNDFLNKLRSSVEQVQEQVKSLNRALREARFGTDRYQFMVGKNPDYAEYYEMIMAPESMEGEGGIFAIPFQNKYGQLVADLFNRIVAGDDTQMNARKQSELQDNINRYTDFRTYLKFDLETTDQNGSRQLLSQTLGSKSGGETQTPFYIAVLASFAQLYRVNDLSSFGNTVRLVMFDEAFNKMDSDRIIESVRLLRKMNLQAIICTPPDKVAEIMPQADRTLLVGKEKYSMRILPYSKEMVERWSKSSS